MSTAWEKVEFEGDLAPWELREMEEGNLAAFATRSFKKGEKICSERPTVWVSGHHPFNEEQVAEIEEKVMSLNDIDRASFYDMANVFPDAPTPAAGIFMTNCFDMADAAHGQSCAMYCAIGRLNHSCEPNAQQTHIPDTFVEVLYASRDIAVGDEINDCYIDLRQSTHERRVALQDIYRFHCTCKACLRADEDKVKNENEETEGEVNSVSVSVFASASIGTGVCEQDRERVKAHLNDDRVVSTVDKGDVERALAIATDAVKQLQRSENLRWSVRYLPDAHLSVHQLAMAVYEHTGVTAYVDEAQKHLKSAWLITVTLQGEESPDAISIKGKIKRGKSGKKSRDKKGR